MQKLNKKGFLLSEALIVATIILTTITLLFIEYSKIYVNYRTRLRWNDVDAALVTASFQNFISDETRGRIIVEAVGNNTKYVLNCNAFPVEDNQRAFCDATIGSENTNNRVANIFFIKGLNNVYPGEFNANEVPDLEDFNAYRRFLRDSLDVYNNETIIIIVVLEDSRYAAVTLDVSS